MKETDRVLRCLLARDRTAALSVVLAVVAWLIEAALDAFVFRLGPLHERLLPLNDPSEIWMRVEAIGTFLILSAYCHVIIAQRKRGEAEGAVLVVRDRGVGIGEDEVPHIVRPFYRAATAQDAPGAGLGLARAKTIVEHHGGQISVAGALGVGTTVVVVLPPPGQRPAPDGQPARGLRGR